MSGVRFQFSWKVAAQGYEWILAYDQQQGLKETRLALVVSTPNGYQAPEGDGYNPEPNPALFRVLAETPPEQDDILDFANRYGNLGTETKLFPAKGTMGKQAGAVIGSFLDSWRGQIGSLRRLCGLWDLIHRQDLAALACYFIWQESPDWPAVHFNSHPEPFTPEAPPLGHDVVRESIPFDASEPGLIESHRTGDVLLPAKLYLQGVLDQHLNHASDDVKVAMAWDSRREQPTLGYWCPTLISAVWLQFATAVNENLTYGRCRECGKWFEVAPKAARVTRRFCSTACRSKAYRERQEKARRMFAEKKKIEQIAEELDSDLATVRRWITGFKE
jgi:hypothetical protein